MLFLPWSNFDRHLSSTDGVVFISTTDISVSSFLVIHVVRGFLPVGQPVAGVEPGGQPTDGGSRRCSGSHHLLLLLHLHLGRSLSSRQCWHCRLARCRSVSGRSIKADDELRLWFLFFVHSAVCVCVMVLTCVKCLWLLFQQGVQTLFSLEKLKNVSFEEEYIKLFPPLPPQALVWLCPLFSLLLSL